MVVQGYAHNVFINCPFDEEYKPLFDAIVFGIFDCGYVARCALEIADSEEVRIATISRIITECKFGVHDISRTELDSDNGLPRFNMPLELGLFFGAKRFGTKQQKEKSCLILDRKRYRFQEFISDIAGQDIQAHDDDPRTAIGLIRNWLQASSGRKTIPGPASIWNRYQRFLADLPAMCSDLHLLVEEMIFNDYANIASEWLKENGR